jgi:uncharacterized delta-60 repeat protein
MRLFRRRLIFIGLLTVLASAVFVVPALAAPGDLDETFSGDGTVEDAEPGDPKDGFSSSVAVAPGGEVMVAGQTEVARYTAGGVLDRSFAGDGTTTVDLWYIADLAVQPDGRVLVLGPTALGSGETQDFAFIRLRLDGTLDPSFGDNGQARVDLDGRDDTPSAIALDADGRIVAVGRIVSSERPGGVVRLLPDGTPDPTFSSDGRLLFDGSELFSLALRGDGSLIAAGGTVATPPQYPPAIDTTVYSILADGTLDPGFAEGGVFRADVGGAATSLAIEPGGRIAVAMAHPIIGTSQLSLARLSSQGTLLNVFLRTYDYAPVALAVDESGGLLAAGVRAGHKAPRFSVARFDGDQLDSSFGQQGAAVAYFGFEEGIADDLAFGADGKIVVAGTTRTGFKNGLKYVVARFEMAPGPRDADADGRGDRVDRCPLRYAPNRSGCPKARRHLLMKAREAASSLKGRIDSELRDCLVRERVQVIRVLPGRDETVATVRTRPYGKWQLHRSISDGRYVAVAKSHIDHGIGRCAEARGGPVELP